MECETNQIILTNPSWWRRRTNLERRVMVVAALLFLVAVVLIVGLCTALMHEKYPYNPYVIEYAPENLQDCPECANDNMRVCLAPGCVHAASTVLSYMDQAVDPCEDFYHFACGGFLNSTNIPGNAVSVDSFTFAYDLLQEQMRTVVEDPPKHANLKPFSFVKRLYDMCMNTEAIEAYDLRWFLDILSRLGGWPVLEEDRWNERNFNWTKSILAFRRSGYNENYFLSLEVSSNPSNSSRYFLVIDQAALGPEEQILVGGLADARVRAYYHYMVDVAVMLGANVTLALSELKPSLEFEIALAKKAAARRDIWNVTFHRPMTIEELQHAYPNISWVEYINGIVDLADFTVSYDDMVVVRVPHYLRELQELLQYTSKRIQANYMMWKAVKSSVKFLTEQLRSRQLEYFRAVYGVTERESRWKECVDVVYQGMPFVVGSLYVHKYVQEEDKGFVLDMVANIRNQFVEILRRVDWMDDTTRIKAFDKAQAISVQTPYSEEFLSTKKIQAYYSQLEFTNDNYLLSVLNLNLFEKNKYYEKLHKYVGRSERNDDVYIRSAHPHYDSLRNVLTIPNGLLQGNFFKRDRPHYLNYGALGYVIGHEIAHGFDDTGRQYDQFGNPADWWTEYTKTTFAMKAHCIYKHFRNYSVSEIELYENSLTSSECNIADNGGLKAAYLAYNIWADGYEKEFRLPSVSNFTPQQLFWIAAAQTKCTKYRQEFLKQEGFSEHNSPAYFTVHSSFSNNEYFSRDFHCRLGSTMNPINKCGVW